MFIALNFVYGLHVFNILCLIVGPKLFYGMQGFMTSGCMLKFDFNPPKLFCLWKDRFGATILCYDT